MEFLEEQMRDILELKERISQQIEKHKEEIESLEKNLSILNQTGASETWNSHYTEIVKHKTTCQSIPARRRP